MAKTLPLTDADGEVRELTEEDFKRMRPAAAVLPEIFPAEIARELLKPRGRPRLDQPKVHLNLRLDATVVEEFKTTGPGWQSRINQALKEWIEGYGRSKEKIS